MGIGDAGCDGKRKTTEGLSVLAYLTRNVESMNQVSMMIVGRHHWNRTTSLNIINQHNDFSRFTPQLPFPFHLLLSLTQPSFIRVGDGRVLFRHVMFVPVTEEEEGRVNTDLFLIQCKPRLVERSACA